MHTKNPEVCARGLIFRRLGRQWVSAGERLEYAEGNQEFTTSVHREGARYH